MDNKTQTIIYALDAIECSVRTHLKLILGLKALMEPEPYTCDLEPEPGDEPLYPSGIVLNTVSTDKAKISTFEPPAVVDNPVPPCAICNHDCTSCSDQDKCHDFSCMCCRFTHTCAFRT